MTTAQGRRPILGRSAAPSKGTFAPRFIDRRLSLLGLWGQAERQARITPTASDVLQHLVAAASLSEGPLSQAELARRTRRALNSVRAAVRQLLDLGWIAKGVEGYALVLHGQKAAEKRHSENQGGVQKLTPPVYISNKPKAFSVPQPPKGAGREDERPSRKRTKREIPVMAAEQCAAYRVACDAGITGAHIAEGIQRHRVTPDYLRGLLADVRDLCAAGLLRGVQGPVARALVQGRRQARGYVRQAARLRGEQARRSAALPGASAATSTALPGELLLPASDWRRARDRAAAAQGVSRAAMAEEVLTAEVALHRLLLQHIPAIEVPNFERGAVQREALRRRFGIE